MAADTDTDTRPGEPTTTGEGAEGFPHGSYAPFVLATGIFGLMMGFLVPLAWIFGVPVTVLGLYLWIREYAFEEYESGVVPAQKRRRLGVPSIYLAGVFAIVSELLLFGGAFVGWFFLAAQRGPFPTLGLPHLSALHGLYEVAALFVGSVALYWSRSGIGSGVRSRLSTGLPLTFLAGLAYLALVWWDWTGLMADGLTPDAGAYGAAYYFVSGLHAAHVLVGLTLVSIAAYRYWVAGHFSENRYSMVRVTEAYWHFLTGVSAVILLLVYVPTS